MKEKIELNVEEEDSEMSAHLIENLMAAVRDEIVHYQKKNFIPKVDSLYYNLKKFKKTDNEYDDKKAANKFIATINRHVQNSYVTALKFQTHYNKIIRLAMFKGELVFESFKKAMDYTKFHIETLKKPINDYRRVLRHKDVEGHIWSNYKQELGVIEKVHEDDRKKIEMLNESNSLMVKDINDVCMMMKDDFYEYDKIKLLKDKIIGYMNHIKSKINKDNPDLENTLDIIAQCSKSFDSFKGLFKNLGGNDIELNTALENCQIKIENILIEIQIIKESIIEHSTLLSKIAPDVSRNNNDKLLQFANTYLNIVQRKKELILIIYKNNKETEEHIVEYIENDVYKEIDSFTQGGIDKAISTEQGRKDTIKLLDDIKNKLKETLDKKIIEECIYPCEKLIGKMESLVIQSTAYCKKYISEYENALNNIREFLPINFHCFDSETSVKENLPDGSSEQVRDWVEQRGLSLEKINEIVSQVQVSEDMLGSLLTHSVYCQNRLMASFWGSFGQNLHITFYNGAEGLISVRYLK